MFCSVTLYIISGADNKSVSQVKMANVFLLFVALVAQGHVFTDFNRPLYVDKPLNYQPLRLKLYSISPQKAMTANHVGQSSTQILR